MRKYESLHPVCFSHCLPSWGSGAKETHTDRTMENWLALSERKEREEDNTFLHKPGKECFGLFQYFANKLASLA